MYIYLYLEYKYIYIHTPITPHPCTSAPLNLYPFVSLGPYSYLIKGAWLRCGLS